jgi:5-methylcytosine-specific restriction protein A
MTLNPLMLRERVVIPPRKAPTKAEKVAAWNLAGGLCELCLKPVPPAGPDVEYDHREAREITGDDTAANLRPLHVRCHSAKSARHDAPLIAKTHRQEKLTRAKVKTSRGFRQHPTLKRAVGGRVVPR